MSVCVCLWVFACVHVCLSNCVSMCLCAYASVLCVSVIVDASLVSLLSGYSADWSASRREVVKWAAVSHTLPGCNEEG